MDAAFPTNFFATTITRFDLTLEEFHTFHSIDRKLYYNLVVKLRRDPTRSLHIVALFLWLERESRNNNLVFTVLRFPIRDIDTLTVEADVILTCIENDSRYFLRCLANKSVSRMQILAGYRFSLAYFHQHRGVVVEGVRRIAGDVCMAALHDILRAVTKINRSNGNVLTTASMMPFLPFSDACYYGPGTNPPTMVKRGGFIDLLLREQSKQELDDEIGELIRQLPKEEPVDNNPYGYGQPQDVPPDERTVFLTFSKGYPITENEVHEYFVRKYGNVVESVFMQEVPHHSEQPLYARLVLRSASAMDSILDSKGKEKFSINGKHVCARKYLRK